MKRKRTMTITKVRRQTVTVMGTALTAWCPLCRCEVDTVSQTDAITALQLAGWMLEGALDFGGFHRIEVGSGNTRICKQSIISNQGRQKQP